MYAGTAREEILSERRAQLKFEMQFEDELKDADVQLEGNPAEELRKLGSPDAKGSVRIEYTAEKVERLKRFQDWCKERVKKTGAVIESCPTSNLRIAGLTEPGNHPLVRFLRAGLPVVIGADDPGILDTDLNLEFEEAAAWTGVAPRDIKTMQTTAAASISEVLSGRRSRNSAQLRRQSSAGLPERRVKFLVTAKPQKKRQAAERSRNVQNKMKP